MTLVAAIRESISDRALSRSEIDNLVEIAAREEGVSAAELQQILTSFEQTDDGFTPAHRAQLWVRLTGLPTRPEQALQLLKRTPAEATEGAHALTETAIRFDMLGEALADARSTLSYAARDLQNVADPEAFAQGRFEMRPPAEGETHDEEQVARFEELKTAFLAAQADTLAASRRLFAAMDIHPYDVIAVLAGFDYSARYRWDRLQREVPDYAVVGMDPVDAARVQRPVPRPPSAPTEPDKNFARVELEEPTAWSYDWRGNTLQLPEGCQIAKLPPQGDLAIRGRGVTLPNGTVLDGTIRVTDGKMKLSRGQLSMNGLPVRARSGEADVRITRGFVVGGPDIEIPLPVIPMPEEPDPTPPVEGETPAEPPAPKAETRAVRFTFERSTLPDGTLLHRGSGEMQVIYRGEEAIGILEGSVSLKKGAIVIESPEGEEPLSLTGHRGAPGQLESGHVYLQGDEVVGFGPSSKATIDGITIETDRNAEKMVSYKFSTPAVFQLGEGATVKELTHPQAVITGKNVVLALGDTEVHVESGGVIIQDGRVAGILPGAVVHLNGAEVTAGSDVLTVLHERPDAWPDGETLFVSKDLIEASGHVTIRGSGSEGLLPAPTEGDNPTRASIELLGGKVRLERKQEPVSPEYIEVQLSGGNVTSGRHTYGLEVKDSEDPARGPIMRITDQHRTVEIDPRPMWPSGEITEEREVVLASRVRELPFIQSAHLFGGAHETEVTQILNGQKTLEQGARGELVTRAQQALQWYLGGGVTMDGNYSAAMASAVSRFQRLNGLEETSKLDAATMRRLDAVAPPADKVGETKPKVMVMVAMNGDVPDEFGGFRQRPELHGATPVIIGPPDQKLKESSDLERFFQQAERGEIDFDWLVISGHSGGSSTWGSFGTLDYDDLKDWTRAYPAAAAQIEKLQLLNCYNVTVERANSFWPEMFPNIVAMGGFMYSAPGKKAQSSDENLLHAGRMFARIDKGEVPNQGTASSIGRRYASDNYIKWQNASVWVRYRNDDGTENGHFDMTNSAKWEMRQHGASDELEVAAYQQAQIYEHYFEATEDEYAEPPAEHHSGPLREYLNAVDGVLGRWEARLRQLERYQRMSREDPDFEIPEEFQHTWGWERQVDQISELRSRILFLIYSPDVRKFFDERYGHTIQALNGILEQNGSDVRFPHGEALRTMTRKETLEMLDRVKEAVQELPRAVRDTDIEDDAWRIMVGTNPEETVAVSPKAFVTRAIDFLKYMKSDYIAAEWL